MLLYLGLSFAAGFGLAGMLSWLWARKTIATMREVTALMRAQTKTSESLRAQVVAVEERESRYKPPHSSMIEHIRGLHKEEGES